MHKIFSFLLGGGSTMSKIVCLCGWVVMKTNGFSFFSFLFFFFLFFLLFVFRRFLHIFSMSLRAQITTSGHQRKVTRWRMKTDVSLRLSVGIIYVRNETDAFRRHRITDRKWIKSLHELINSLLRHLSLLLENESVQL